MTRSKSCPGSLHFINADTVEELGRTETICAFCRRRYPIRYNPVKREYYLEYHRD